MKNFFSSFSNRFFNKYIGDLAFLIWIIAGLPLLSLIWRHRCVSFFSKERNVMYSVAFGLLVFLLSSNFTRKRRTAILWVVYVGAFLPAFIVLSYINIASVYLMQADFVPVYVTDQKESLAFMHQYISYQLIVCWICYFLPPLFYLLFIKRIPGLPNTSSPTKNITPNFKIIKLVITVVAVASSIARISSDLDSMSHIYFLDFYYSFFKYRGEIQQFQQLIKARESRTDFEVKQTIKGPGQKVFVVVIGESLSRNHMGLYNYKRPTSPLLTARKNDLLVFNDVVSGAVGTNESLRLSLTFADNKSNDNYYNKPSIVELFKSAGVKTYWIDNQELTDRTGNVFGVIAKSAHKLENPYIKGLAYHDEVLLEPFGKILDDTTESKVIFIHLAGSHITYRTRYPALFNHFTDATDLSSSLPSPTSTQINTINEYDNSVLYNDYIVSAVIDSLEKCNAISYMLYFSDHGEEVYDFRDHVGHLGIGVASHYLCEVPFILWRSDSYKKTVNIDIDVNRPYDNEDLIYSVSQLSGLSYKEYDSTRSIFSRVFRPKERLVSGLSYDSLLRRFPGK